MHISCDFSYVIKTEGFHVYCKRGNISKNSAERDVVTTEYRSAIGSDIWPIYSGNLDCLE